MKMNYLSNWLDIAGFLHLRIYPSIDDSVNGPMFTGLLHSLFPLGSRGRKERINLLWEEVNGELLFRKDICSETYDFSHDNMTGLYCLFNDKHTKDIRKQLPLFTSQIFHPRDIFFYLYCQNRIIGSFFLFIPIMSMIVSCLQTYKYRDGKKMIRTDGKLLALMRCKAYKLNLTFKLLSFIIRKKKDFGSWRKVAEIYFKETGHPIKRLLIEQGL